MAVCASPRPAAEVTIFVMALWQRLSGWHLERGELREALATVDEALAVARRLGEVSAMIPSLVLHMLILWKLDRPGRTGRDYAAQCVADGRSSAPASVHRSTPDSPKQLDAGARARLAAEGTALGMETLSISHPGSSTPHRRRRRARRDDGCVEPDRDLGDGRPPGEVSAEPERDQGKRVHWGAIHLSTARQLGSDLGHVVSYDDRMLNAARLLGLATAAPD